MNANKKRLDEILSSISDSDKYEIEAKLLIAQFVDAILSVMESSDVNRKKLAKKIGTSPSFITQVFKGNKIINFLTLAKIQEALSIKFNVSVKRQSKHKKFDSKSIVEMSKSFQETNVWAYKIKSDYDNSDFSPIPGKLEKELY